MAKQSSFHEDALNTINQLRSDKQELLTALEVAYEQLERLGCEGDSMLYVETVLYKFDIEEAA